MESGIYKIGEFSLKSGFSVKTLRYYDSIGLLNPSIVDKFTNYRYYTAEDLEQAKYIKLLKSLDFSLEEIIVNKNGLSREALDRKQKELALKIEEMQFKYDKIDSLKRKVRGKILKM